MATHIGAGDLLLLQGHIKRDAQGYHEEFLLQYRHYKSCLGIFGLKPDAESKEFADLVMFLSQVAPSYPHELKDFPNELMNLLEQHANGLHPALRRNLAQALILLRNRQVIGPTLLLPLFFRLFRCADKSLRQLLFAHIIADIRRSNLKHRDDRLNHTIQNYLYTMVQDENEGAAKKSLAVLIELYRRRIWTDAKTVNIISTACLHPASRIMVGALKFFLGADRVEEEGESDSDEDDGKSTGGAVAMDREAVYKAFHKGTSSSKKKKQAKLKRVLQGLKKQQRSANGPGEKSCFAALHLLHDPQGLAEKLFARLKGSNEKFEVKVMMMNMISRIIGSHSLLLLNFYPFLQRYVQPHQRDVTHLLVTAVQACHEQVPPDVVEPLLRQLVNQFIHDRARPEVMAVGMNTVREMCARMPLLMTEELLQDLALYKKAREKPVAAAARGLIALFRELAPALLEKKDRGRNADLHIQPKAFGEAAAREGVLGAEFLEVPSSDDDQSDSDVDASDEVGKRDAGNNGASVVGEEEEEAEVGEDEDGNLSEGDDCSNSSLDQTLMDVSEDEGESSEVQDEDLGEKTTSDADCDQPQSNSCGKQCEDSTLLVTMHKDDASISDSLRSLRRKAAACRPVADSEGDRILSNEDFQHIRRVQAKRVAESALAKHGLKKQRSAAAGNYKNPSGDRGVDPGTLEVSIKARQEKQDRLDSILSGREGRDFGSRTVRKQKKTGGSSNRQKQKQKAMPLAAQRAKLKQRTGSKKGTRTKNKQFQGKKAWKT